MSTPLVAAAARQRIRGPNLAVLVKGSPGIPMEEALRKADSANSVIASNRRFSQALDESTEGTSMDGIKIMGALPAWTGTMVAYAKRGAEFGASMVCTDSTSGLRYVFEVPPQYQKVKNGLLIVEHPGYSIVPDGKTRVVIPAANVGLLENFPASEGWYAADPVYGIPAGNPANPASPGAKGLMRYQGAGMVCLVGRTTCPSLRHVYLIFPPSARLGLVVEAAAEDTPKIRSE